MRYIKVLVIVFIFFVGFIFLFQNQAPLSQRLTLQLDLLVVPQMKSIELPFYFVVVGGFVVGAILTLLLLLWDRMSISAKLMRANWRTNAIESENRKLLAEMEKMSEAAAKERPAMFDRIKGEYMAKKKGKTYVPAAEKSEGEKS